MPTGSTRSDTLNFRAGGMAAGAMLSDRKDAEEYGELNAERLARQAAEPDSAVAWRAVQAVESDVDDILHSIYRAHLPPGADGRQLRRAAKRVAALLPRLADPDHHRRASDLLRKIREASAP